MTDEQSTRTPGPSDEPRWPNVVGMITLLVATVGIVAYGCCGGGSLFLQPFLDRSAGEALTAVQQELLRVQQEVNRRFFLWMLFNALASTGLSIFLMVGGLSLIRREKWAPGALTTWAVLRLIHVPLVAVMVLIQGLTHWSAREDALTRMDATATDPELLMTIWLWGLPVAVLIWGCLLPAFMLIWFRLPSVRAETATWRAGRPLRL